MGLLGNPAAIGEDFHITSADVLTWNQIHSIIGDAAGIPADALAAQAVYIPSPLLARFDAEAFEGPLMGDKANAALFDTSKLEALVPEFATRHTLADSIGDSMAWFKADAARARASTTTPTPCGTASSSATPPAMEAMFA